MAVNESKEAYGKGRILLGRRNPGHRGSLGCRTQRNRDPYGCGQSRILGRDSNAAGVGRDGGKTVRAQAWTRELCTCEVLDVDSMASCQRLKVSSAFKSRQLSQSLVPAVTVE